MSESMQHDEQGSSLHDRWCLRYDEQCSSLHAEGLRQPEDGQYGLKHVAVHLAIKYTYVTQLCLTIYSFQVNDTPISDIHCHTGIIDDRKLESKIMWPLMAWYLQNNEHPSIDTKFVMGR